MLALINSSTGRTLTNAIIIYYVNRSPLKPQIRIHIQRIHHGTSISSVVEAISRLRRRSPELPFYYRNNARERRRSISDPQYRRGEKQDELCQHIRRRIEREYRRQISFQVVADPRAKTPVVDGVLDVEGPKEVIDDDPTGSNAHREDVAEKVRTVADRERLAGFEALRSVCEDDDSDGEGNRKENRMPERVSGGEHTELPRQRLIDKIREYGRKR